MSSQILLTSHYLSAEMNVNLTLIDGPQTGQNFSFNEPDNFLLGRDNEGSKAHLRLNNNDTQISRNHFLLEINPPDCFIRDVGSLNGTLMASRNDNKSEYEFRAAKLKDKLGYSS